MGFQRRPGDRLSSVDHQPGGGLDPGNTVRTSATGSTGQMLRIDLGEDLRPLKSRIRRHGFAGLYSRFFFSIVDRIVDSCFLCRRICSGFVEDIGKHSWHNGTNEKKEEQYCYNTGACTRLGRPPAPRPEW